MKLKGHATFELTNVETGETRIVEEDNMITNAFTELVKGSGVYGYQLHNRLFNQAYSGSTSATSLSGYTYANVPLKLLAGGLVLFSDTLEEDADHVYITGDDPEVTGIGTCDFAYTGNQLQAGSYNSAESGEIENGYKHIWDFTTSQANGPIGCACLTSAEGANIGFGLDSAVNDWYGDPYKYRASESIVYPRPDDYWYYDKTTRCMYINEEKNTMTVIKNSWSIPTTSTQGTNYITNEPDPNGKLLTQQVFTRSFLVTKSIDFTVYRFPYNNLSIFDTLNKYTTETKKYEGSSSNTYNNPNLKVLKTVTVEMPQALKNVISNNLISTSNRYNWLVDIDLDEGFMYISFTVPKEPGYVNEVVQKNENIYVWKINMDTFESTSFTITNTTGSTLTYDYDNYFPSKRRIVGNNYSLVWSDTGTYDAWIIENNNNANVKKLKYSDDTDFNMQSMTILYQYKDIVYTYKYYSSSKGTYYIINMKTGIVKVCRITEPSSYYSTIGITHGTKFPKVVALYVYRTYENNMYWYTNPMFLLTINNLTNKVQKTSAETMKVTYTLTRYEEPIEEPEEE